MATARRLAVLDLRDAEASCPKDLQLIRTEVERILAVHKISPILQLLRPKPPGLFF